MTCHKLIRKRRGAILVIVLGCLAVAAALSVVILRQMAVEHRSAQRMDRNLQARWLAEAGIERAAGQLAADPKYSGETWTIPAIQLADNESADNESAVVKIHVETVADQPNRRTVRVEADYGDTPEGRCRSVKQIPMDLEVIQPKPSTEAADEDREN